MKPQDRYQPGDIFVQCKGQPWVWLANVATGYPFPHAQMVSKVDELPNVLSKCDDPKRGIYGGCQIWILEDSADGIKEKLAYNLDQYEIWRPQTDDATKKAAVQRMRSRIGQAYGYGRLLEIFLGYRLGLAVRTGIDDDPKFDNRRMVCSESIAWSYLRAGQETGSGYDAAPHITDRDTLPHELRNPASKLIWSPLAA